MPVRGMDLVAALLAIESCPVNVPALVGSKSTCTEIDWPGFRVAGNAAPEMEKPVPLTDAEFRVKGAVPVDEILSDCS